MTFTQIADLSGYFAYAELGHTGLWVYDLRVFHRRFEQEGVKVQQEVTHGNALGIYFFDPEGNRNEVYLRIERDVRQPFRKSIDFSRSPEEIYAEAERLLADGGAAYQPVR